MNGEKSPLADEELEAAAGGSFGGADDFDDYLTPKPTCAVCGQTVSASAVQRAGGCPCCGQDPFRELLPSGRIRVWTNDRPSRG